MTRLPTSRNRRTNALMREFVDLVTHSVEAGLMSVADAGRLMNSVGVPFEVACRVLPRAHRA